MYQHFIPLFRDQVSTWYNYNGGINLNYRYKSRKEIQVGVFCSFLEHLYLLSMVITALFTEQLSLNNYISQSIACRVLIVVCDPT